MKNNLLRKYYEWKLNKLEKEKKDFEKFKNREYTLDNFAQSEGYPNYDELPRRLKSFVSDIVVDDIRIESRWREKLENKRNKLEEKLKKYSRN